MTLPKFCTPECRNDFRKSFRNVPSKAFIRRDNGKLALYVRPVNLLEFGASVNRHGLEGCEPTKAILRHLDKNKEEYIRFEHVAL
jgi:hypothetical protein